MNHTHANKTNNTNNNNSSNNKSMRCWHDPIPRVGGIHLGDIRHLVQYQQELHPHPSQQQRKKEKKKERTNEGKKEREKERTKERKKERKKERRLQPHFNKVSAHTHHNYNDSNNNNKLIATTPSECQPTVNSKRDNSQMSARFALA